MKCTIGKWIEKDYKDDAAKLDIVPKVHENPGKCLYRVTLKKPP